jgi:GAF domain-containing protein
MLTPASDTNSLNKEEKYLWLLQQASELLSQESDLIANLANLSALIHQTFAFHWTGFYRVNEAGSELILGPFQGPVACTRIAFAKGVCGTAWKEKKIIRVNNVADFPGHIACSPHTQSEIVVPIIKDQRVMLLLDIDSEHLNAFDETDENYLEHMARLIVQHL